MQFKDVPSEHFLTGGHGTCTGCGAAIGLKLVLSVLGKNTIVLNAAGCFTLLPTYPHTPFKVPWIHENIEGAGAMCSGINAALRAKKRKATILAYIGDGATYDIGLQSLSDALQRKDDFIWICYDNQNFANTGVQKTSATPKLAYTTTTPLGNPFMRKPITKIVAAHGIPYVATASVGYPLDFIEKLKKAQKIKGPKFIDLLTTCIPGWGVAENQCPNIAKLAVDTGAWPLYEIENGKFKLNSQKTKPVKEYLEKQSRFKHLKPSDIKNIQKWIDAQWNNLSKGKFWETEEY